MTYEEENIEINKKIIDINSQIEELKNKQREINLYRYKASYMDPKIEILELSINQKITALRYLKSNLEDRLKESPSQRKLNNVIAKGVTSLHLDKLPDPPRHISGRVYEVSDGCATWCLWFCIIDGIILLLFFLLSE